MAWGQRLLSGRRTSLSGADVAAPRQVSSQTSRQSQGSNSTTRYDLRIPAAWMLWLLIRGGKRTLHVNVIGIRKNLNQKPSSLCCMNIWNCFLLSQATDLLSLLTCSANARASCSHWTIRPLNLMILGMIKDGHLNSQGLDMVTN